MLLGHYLDKLHPTCDLYVPYVFFKDASNNQQGEEAKLK